MKTSKLFLVALAAGAVLFASCSELKDDLKEPPTGAGGVHGPEWSDPVSPEFHGRFLKAQSWNDAECRSCHGGDYGGGTSGVSCLTCHPAYPHRAVFPDGRHTQYVRQTLFPLDQCQVCHGTSYAGGPITDISCLTSGCHVDAAGAQKSPEACNTCHGQFRAPESDVIATAPPASVAGDTSSALPAVGAHAAHLTYGRDLQSVKCAECHLLPAVWNASGHIDPTPAEIVFNDSLGRKVTGGGTNVPAPVYDPGPATCSGTYCHGNWAFRESSAPIEYAFAYADSVIRGGVEGGVPSPVWTGGSSQTGCGTTCHTLPPRGHLLSGPTCNGCHTGVADANNNILDQTLHINGKANVFGTERPLN
jgi:hypothetical protein